MKLLKVENFFLAFGGQAAKNREGLFTLRRYGTRKLSKKDRLLIITAGISTYNRIKDSIWHENNVVVNSCLRLRVIKSFNIVHCL